MSDQMAQDLRIWDTLQTSGWQDIRGIVMGMIAEEQDALLHAMGRKPDTLTGKVAIKHAARRLALMDFLETLDDKMRLLESKRSK